MEYPTPNKLTLPVSPYSISGYSFGQKIRRHILLWATHLGHDINLAAGTPVIAIGAGQIVRAEIRRGSATKKNWGGVVIIAHNHKITGKPFYSIYGHIKQLSVKEGDIVSAGQLVGNIADRLTPENGWWKIPHLHFAIYIGPWRDCMFPGFKRVEQRRTKVKWWRNPQKFITEYNKQPPKSL